MDRWVGKVAVITGAGSGIGKATAKALVKKNLKVVGLDIRFDRLENVESELKYEKGSFYPLQCDISKEEDILKSFEWTQKQLGGVDILINNAGIFLAGLMIESSTENLKKMTDINFIGPVICIREAVKNMRARNTSGHIVNICSILGQNVEFWEPPLNLYSPTKFAIRAVSQLIELELKSIHSCIKVTNICPGLVNTNMPPKTILDEESSLEPEDIGDGILYALSTPAYVQVKELTIIPVPGYQRNKAQN